MPVLHGVGESCINPFKEQCVKGNVAFFMWGDVKKVANGSPRMIKVDCIEPCAFLDSCEEELYVLGTSGELGVLEVLACVESD